MKYYTFIAIETGEPHPEWAFTVGIDEAFLTGTLGRLCDGQVQFDRVDTYLLATCIIHHKARSLLRACNAGAKFRFSPFKALDTKPQLTTPDYQAGGLYIWFMNPPANL